LIAASKAFSLAADLMKAAEDALGLHDVPTAVALAKGAAKAADDFKPTVDHTIRILQKARTAWDERKRRAWVSTLGIGPRPDAELRHRQACMGLQSIDVALDAIVAASRAVSVAGLHAGAAPSIFIQAKAE
jgi:hypothetical protein